MDNNEINIPTVLFQETGKIPRKAHPSDAGFDLYATHDCVVEPLQRKIVSVGIGIAIPEGYAGLIMPRSGLAAKHGISIVNTPGLIDSNYRGELKVILYNSDNAEAFTVETGDRIAQLVILRLPEVSFIPVSTLHNTDRGSDGFGSSGIR